MDVRLPVALQAALDGVVEGRSRRSLTERAAAISSHYRRQAPSSDVVQLPDDALAYALSRMPATYAAIAAVLGELRDRAPHFAPTTVADVGAGPGTASWAAARAFPMAQHMVQIDHNPEFLTFAGDLARHGPPLVAGALRLDSDVRQPLPGEDKFDLMIAGYALTELTDDDMLVAGRALWVGCRGVLVVVEPGRPRDFERLLSLRADLMGQGARMVAPCPHEDDCPLPTGDWCHFSVRLSRSRDHMTLKGASLPYEDEKYSYLVVARPGVAVSATSARIIAPPRETKFGRELPLCTREGLRSKVIRKREKALFRAARHLDWGDVLDVEAEEAGRPT